MADADEFGNVTDAEGQSFAHPWNLSEQLSRPRPAPPGHGESGMRRPCRGPPAVRRSASTLKTYGEFGTLAFSELKLKGSHEAGFLLGAATAVVLFVLGIHAGRDGFRRPDAYFTYENLLELLLPILLTMGLIPFVYATALLTTYGGLFSRLNWKLEQQPGIRRYAKRRVLQAGNIRLGRAHRLAQKLAWKISPTDTSPGVDAIEQALSSDRDP
jgi:hypothetical protein